MGQHMHRVSGPRFPRRGIVAAGALLLAVTAVSAVSRPALLAAFTVTGESLNLDQRDFRVFDNFADPQANDNTFPHPNFPGQTGAVMAIWKAHAEWASEPRAGNGLGDGLASNPNLGDGGANFDNTFQGQAPDSGGTNGNVHSAGTGFGSVLAFTQAPVSDGWQIVYNDSFLWDDGPGTPVDGALDLQAIATREIGHAIGLGNSSVAGATMGSMISGDGTGPRSIAADDIAGIQAIYGVKSASKPHIGALAGSTDVGGSLTILGSQFAALGNEVWFTSATADGTPLKLTGMTSTAGGTQINVIIPLGAAPGEVLVRIPGTSGASLSNAFPLDVGRPPGSFTLSGPGLAGGAEVPQLTGAGDLTPGSATPFTLDVQLVAPLAPGALFVALNEANLPFKGGTFDPAPILVQLSLTTNAGGKLVLAALMPAGVPPGTHIVAQAWWHDVAAVQGASATNSLTLVVP